MTEAVAQANVQLRILCFGNSLTCGYHKWGMEYHPYAIRLEERLKQHDPSLDIQITIDGLPADKVINGLYTQRLTSKLENGQSYDWIIMMGGTNDLGLGKKVVEVFEALRVTWRQALDSGAKVLALTVPESANRGGHATKRKKLNDMIMSHREESKDGKKRFYVADVAVAIPWPEAVDEQDRIWDDGLHFTPVGYGMLGDAIADTLLEILNASAKKIKD